MEHKVAHSVHAEEIHQLIRVEHISLGLAHLAVSLEKPWVPKHLLGKGQIQGHEEDGPVNGVETDNILSDQMEVCRPVFLELLCAIPVTVISDSGNIVGQGVQPHVHYMVRVKVHRNSPFKGGPGHAQILQSREEEIVHHLIFP